MRQDSTSLRDYFVTCISRKTIANIRYSAIWGYPYQEFPSQIVLVITVRRHCCIQILSWSCYAKFSAVNDYTTV